MKTNNIPFCHFSYSSGQIHNAAHCFVTAEREIQIKPVRLYLKATRLAYKSCSTYHCLAGSYARTSMYIHCIPFHRVTYIHDWFFWSVWVLFLAEGTPLPQISDWKDRPRAGAADFGEALSWRGLRPSVPLLAVDSGHQVTAHAGGRTFSPSHCL